MNFVNRAVAEAVLLFALSVYISSATYKAAVVEFYPDQFHAANFRVQNNLNGFEKALDTVHLAGGVDIVVFPEDAILGEAFFSREEIAPYLEAIPEVVSTSNNKFNPCSDSNFTDRPILQRLSCLARDYHVVLVANMGDTQPCISNTSKSCPKDGKYYFNTNVVFESDGTLVAKYHKVNLYAGEARIFNPGSYSNSSCISFETSFGVTFGTFTCYDLLFQEPANCLLSKGIKNFVLPTAWGSSYPFYMSVAVQQGWSRKHSVNFLASNQHFKMTYSTGSGIYSNGVARHYIMSGETWSLATGHVVIAELPEDPHQVITNYTQVGNRSDVADIKAKTNTYLNFTLLQRQDGVIEVGYQSINDGSDLVCKLEYTIVSTTNEEQYGLGAYIGTSNDDSKFQFAVCTLVKCTSSGKCGEPVDGYQTRTIFKNILLSGTFPYGSELYATALGNGLKLLDPTTMAIQSNSLTVTNYNLPLLAASLWTRVYS